MSTTARIPFPEKFRNYLRASYPLLWIKTHEEQRVTQEILLSLKDTKTPVTVYSWDAKKLLQKFNRTANNNKGGWEQVKNGDYGLMTVIDNVTKLGASGERCVILMKDFHHYIEAPGQSRPIRNSVEELKCKGNMIVFVSPIIKIPVELEKEIQILEFSLPDTVQLEGILTSVQAAVKKSVAADAKKNAEAEIPADVKTAAIEASKGLTFSEAHDAFALAIVENHGFNNNFVLSVFDEKVKQVKRHGLLNYIRPDQTFEHIGGLTGLKKWIRMRAKAYSQDARDYKLPYPKGVLLAGIPGCGKTMIAKATANEFGFPLFQLDVGSLFGKYVGESEENTRKVVETVDSIGRCVLFIDEIEKSLNRSATSGQGDSGTSSRAFATLLSWLSDHTSPVFVIGTSNDHTKLPTEFTRKGRFDDIFWLDVPSEAERQEIFKVVMAKFGRDAAKLGIKIPKLAEKTDGFTGAEIEQIVVATMFSQFNEGKEITQTALLDEIATTQPLSITNKEEIENMRAKAADRLRVASDSGAAKTFQLSPADAAAERKLDTGGL